MSVKENIKAETVNIEDAGIREEEFNLTVEKSEHELTSGGIGGDGGDGEGVGGVVRGGGSGEIKKLGNHEGDLIFIGATVACDGKFDFVGSEFEEWEVMKSGGEQDDASCMSDGDSGSGIFAEKEFFNTDDIWLKGINE